MVTLAIMSLRPPSGEQPMRRQNALTGDGGSAPEGRRSGRAAAPSLGGEVAAVIAAHRRRRSPAPSGRACVPRSSTMAAKATGRPAVDGHSSRIGFQSQASAGHRPFDARVQHHRVHHGREPGAGLAVGAERQASSDRWPSEHPFGEIVVHRHQRAVDEDAQPLAMVDERAQGLALARLVGQAGELPFGLREQAVERLLQRALCRVERRVWRSSPAVMLQPRLVQAVDRRDPLDPSPAPFRQAEPAAHSIHRAVDEANRTQGSPAPREGERAACRRYSGRRR